MRLVATLLCLVSLAGFALLLQPRGEAMAQDGFSREEHHLHPEFQRFGIRQVAVLPMDNMSFRASLADALYQEVYSRLREKGYVKTSRERVDAVMAQLGIQTPGQLAGIATSRLGDLLGADALMVGQVEQADSIHQGVYDAVVVSCTLRLVHCESGAVLWSTEQWRTAHRQWQLDPINAIINFMQHKDASREERIAHLVHSMLQTLPAGPVRTLPGDNLLDRAVEIQSNAHP
jgi:hypothetical protein